MQSRCAQRSKLLAAYNHCHRCNWLHFFCTSCVVNSCQTHLHTHTHMQKFHARFQKEHFIIIIKLSMSPFSPMEFNDCNMHLAFSYLYINQWMEHCTILVWTVCPFLFMLLLTLYVFCFQFFFYEWIDITHTQIWHFINPKVVNILVDMTKMFKFAINVMEFLFENFYESTF